ncbi:MAG: hypothetical protein ACE5EE_10375 [Fidelibacterota bacterium]
MTPGDFRTRVRERLSDSGSVFDDTMIDNALEDWARDIWPEILRKLPHYYIARASYTGVTDAQDADNEVYLLPSNFRSFAYLRRSDLSNRPTVEYVPNAIVQDMEFIAHAQLYDNPDAPLGSGETWSLYDATQFTIIPAPSATSFTYELTYFKVPDHTSKVDVPDEFLSRAVTEVAYLLALVDDDPLAEKLAQAVQLARNNMHKVSPDNQASVVPEVRLW